MFVKKEVNGGGGGNRTRVRKCVHVSVYVRSLLIRIRHPGPRQARCPGPLGGVGTLRRSPRRSFRVKARCRRRIPLAGGQGYDVAVN